MTVTIGQGAAQAGHPDDRRVPGTEPQDRDAVAADEERHPFLDGTWVGEDRIDQREVVPPTRHRITGQSA